MEGGTGGGGGSKDDQTITIITDFKVRVPAEFSMIDITGKIKDPKDKTPYVVVCLQECERIRVFGLEEMVSRRESGRRG